MLYLVSSQGTSCFASIWQDVSDLEVAMIHSFHRAIKYSSLVTDFVYSDFSVTKVTGLVMTIICISDISAQCIINNICPAFPDNVCCTNTTDHDRECKISGFCCSVDEVFAILGCYVAYVGSCFIKDQAG